MGALYVFFAIATTAAGLGECKCSRGFYSIFKFLDHPVSSIPC